MGTALPTDGSAAVLLLFLFNGIPDLFGKVTPVDRTTGHLFSILLVEFFRLVFQDFLIHRDCLLVYKSRSGGGGVRSIERRGCCLPCIDRSHRKRHFPAHPVPDTAFTVFPGILSIRIA